MWTEDGQYLTENVADILIRALADVNERRPKDPIGYLATVLYTLRYIPQDVKPSGIGKSRSRTVSENGNSDESTIARRMIFESEPSMKDYEESTKESQLITRHRSEEGENILHFAASQPHDEEVIFRLLCHATNASLADRNSNYLTPRDVAVEKEMLNNVLEIDKFVVQLIIQGKINRVKELVVAGYDSMLDLEGKDGMNVIELASKSNNIKMAEFLQLANDFEERREFLHRAIKVGSQPHVEYMADSEDLVSAKDNKGRTSLHIATLCEEKDIMRLLAEKYPSLLTLGDHLGRTPLHYAMAVDGVDEVAKVLVQCGAQRTATDLKGKRPSYYFMNRGVIVNMIKEIYKEEEEMIGE